MTTTYKGKHPLLITIGDHLRDLRLARHWSLAEAGEHHGLKPVTIGSYERVDRTPGIVTVDRLLRGYGERVAFVPLDDPATLHTAGLLSLPVLLRRAADLLGTEQAQAMLLEALGAGDHG